MSLIIAAYNEEDFVRIKMENSLALDYPKEKFHIVWVTDGTTDSTNDRLAAYPEVEVYFSPERKGKTAAINRIMPFVKSPIVIFTDANTMLNSKAVKNMVTEFTDPQVGCVAGEKGSPMNRLCLGKTGVSLQERDCTGSMNRSLKRMITDYIRMSGLPENCLPYDGNFSGSNLKILYWMIL